MWSGHKPSVKHFKIFGRLCYHLVSDQKMSKLDDKKKKGIFLGCSSQSKGYRTFSLKIEKILISGELPLMRNHCEIRIQNQTKSKIESLFLLSMSQFCIINQNQKFCPQVLQSEPKLSNQNQNTRTQLVFEERNISQSLYARFSKVDEIEESCPITIIEPTYFK